MKSFGTHSRKAKGQAMAEMLICIPLLFILAAGIVQFSLLFLSYVNFEHSCGEAARQYNAGFFDRDSLAPAIMENMGSFGRYLDPNSLKISTDSPRSLAGSTLSEISGLLNNLTAIANSLPFCGKVDFSSKYEGSLWNVSVRCQPPAFFRILFPNGIPFDTTMQVYRFKGKS